MSSIANDTKGRLKDFSDYTSLHGVGRIGGVKYVFHKLFWTILFLGSFSFCMFQVYRLANQYASYPISTTLTVSQEEIQFPSITICNLNLVKYTEVIRNPNLFQVIEAIANPSSGINVNLSKFSPDRPLPKYTYETPLTLSESEDLKATDAMRVFNARVANLTDKEMSTSYTDPTDFFVIGCKFNGRVCNKLNFTRFRDDDYGLCYQFTSSTMAQVPGRDAGLEVLISVQQVHYTPYMTKSSGIRGAIHPSNQRPNLKNQGFSLPTGFEVDVEMKAVTRMRIPGPNKRCDDSNKWQSIDDCINNCTLMEAAALCGCTVHRSMMKPEKGIGICLDNSEYSGTECFAREVDAVTSKSICDGCIMPCKESFFQNKFSMTKFPSKKYEPVLQDIQARNFDAVDYKDFRDDILLLRAYFPSLITESVVEERSYTEENFVSDIGGQLGLWIGMSVLSFTEILELIVLLFVTCCKRPRKTSDSSVSGDENSDIKPKEP